MPWQCNVPAFLGGLPPTAPRPSAGLKRDGTHARVLLSSFGLQADFPQAQPTERLFNVIMNLGDFSTETLLQ